MPTKAWIEKELAALCGEETELDFSGWDLDAGDIVSIASAIGSKALLKLDISSCLNAEGGTALAAVLDGNQIMTELNIANNRFCFQVERGIVAIANSTKTMGVLSKLDASNNGMFGKNDETGTTAWAAALKTCTSITALNLAKNGINGNDTTILAAAVSDMGSLSSLNLAANSIGGHLCYNTGRMVATPEGHTPYGSYAYLNCPYIRSLCRPCCYR
jgi:hypothetical protein